MIESEISVHKTMCPMNCHPTYCGMEVLTQNRRIVGVRGDKENPDSRGFLCVRGRATIELVENERRLRTPLRRRGPRGGGEWDPITWDTALDEIADRMRRAGRERVALWPGHGSIVNTIGIDLLRRFGNLYGCQSWNPAIVCWGLGGFGAALTGVLEANTKEDLGEHAQTIFFWGASLVSQPSTAPHLTAARRRGAYVVAIDCRRTELAGHVDEFVILRPGTDAALALALMHVIVFEELHDCDFVVEYTVGFDELAESLRERTPDWAEPITGVPAATIRQLARRYAIGKPATIVMGGASMYKHANGWQASRAISCLPALTGNLGIAGGGLGPRHRGLSHGQSLGTLQLAERRPEGNYSASHMGEIVAALESGQIDALFLAGTNMTSSYADAGRLRKALGQVGFIVGHDLFLNETLRDCADVVLPGTSWVEEIGLKSTYTHVYLMDRV
ncbi:MAG: molybdopterin-dependent oxidoreductase, partial [Chloroflexi bacterium]|nr:molybdopterin-dependent oxidoreductase [Chloroflexota bacterium]